MSWGHPSASRNQFCVKVLIYVHLPVNRAVRCLAITQHYTFLTKLHGHIILRPIFSLPELCFYILLLLVLHTYSGPYHERMSGNIRIGCSRHGLQPHLKCVQVF